MSNNKFTQENYCKPEKNYQKPHNAEKLKKDLKAREEWLQTFGGSWWGLTDGEFLSEYKKILKLYEIHDDDLTKRALQETKYLFLDEELQKEYLRLLFEDGIENFIRKLDRGNMRDVDFNKPLNEETAPRGSFYNTERALSPIENILYSFTSILASNHDDTPEDTRLYLMNTSDDPQNRKDYKLSSRKVAAYLQQYYQDHKDKLKSVHVKDFLKEGIRSYFDEILNDKSVLSNYNNLRKSMGLRERSQYGYDASPDTN